MLKIADQHGKFMLRQGKALLLIVLHPFLVGIILYPLLASLEHPAIHVAAYVPDGTLGKYVNSIVSFAHITYFSDPSSVSHRVLDGRADVGIVARYEGNAPYFEIVSSPLRPTAATLVKSALQLSLLNLAGQAVGEISTSFQRVLSGLSEARNKLQQMGESISSAELRIRGIQDGLPDVSEFQTYVDAMGSYESKIDTYASKIKTYRGRIRDYIEDLREIEDELELAKQSEGSLRAELQSKKLELDYASQQVLSAENDLDAALLYIDENSEAYDYVRSAQQRLTAVGSAVDDARGAVSTAIAYLDDTPIDKYLAKVRSTRESLEEIYDDLGRVEDDLRATKASIAAQRSELSYKLEELEAKEQDVNRNISYLLQALDSAKRRLDGALLALNFGPVSVEQLPQLRYREVLRIPKSGSNYYPFIIALDVLMVGLLLPVVMRSRERDQGIETRLRVLRVSPVSVVVGRYIVYVSFVFLQALVVLLLGAATGYLPFSYISNGVVALFFSTMFVVALGLLVASAVSNVVVGFMTVVLLEVIFVLLSGRLVPIELMSPTMRFIASTSPLAVVSAFMEASTLVGYVSPFLLAVVLGSAFVLVLASAALLSRSQLG